MDTLFRHEESEVLRGFCHSEEWACRCAAEGHMAADAAGAKALVGVIKIIKGHHYDKTREPPWRAMEKRHPPFWWLRHHLPPKGSMSLDSQSSATPYSTAITDSLDSQVA
jgi:hypothetical protein